MRNRPPFDPSLPGLPDILEHDLKLVFVGYNPSLPASRAGHYYAGGQNYFYRMLHLSGLTSRLLSYEEDATLLRYGIGLTDLCKTPSAQVADLPAGMLAEGRDALREKLERYQPQTVCFNGLGVYRAFFGHPPGGLRAAEGAPWLHAGVRSAIHQSSQQRTACRAGSRVPRAGPGRPLSRVTSPVQRGYMQHTI